MKPTIVLIVAASTGTNVIGKGNGTKMPWPQLKGDMASFRQLTIPHPIIMGRKTWETFKDKGGKQIALPNRENIIVTRNINYQQGAPSLCVGSLKNAIRLAASNDPQKIWICGGGEIYREALGYLPDGSNDPDKCVVDEIYLTEVDLDVQGDVFFPGVPQGFRLIESETVEHVETVRIDDEPTVVKYRIKHFVRDQT